VIARHPSSAEVDAQLVEGIDLLCLDAGNTLIFLDHERLAGVCVAHGFATTAGELARAEGVAKRAHAGGTLVDGGWAYPTGSARTWGLYVGTMLAAAGVAPQGLARLLEVVWEEHWRANFWSKVPPGLRDALGRARAVGLRVAVVSNSEGQLESVLARVGLLDVVDLAVDSAIVGVEKPDPRIFQIALDRFGVPPDRALHLGDVYAYDVLGARSARLRVALVDPAGHFAGLYADVPRATGAREVALEAERVRTVHSG
jgi:putative hydrolase of the HAD superfamily